MTVCEQKLKVAFLDPQTNAIELLGGPLVSTANNNVPEDLPPPAYEELPPHNQVLPQPSSVQPSPLQEQQRQGLLLNSELNTPAALLSWTTSTSTPTETMTVMDRGIISNNTNDTNDTANSTRRESVSISAAQSPVQNVPLSVLNSGSSTEAMTVTDHDRNSNIHNDSAIDDRHVSVSTPSTQAPLQGVPLSDVDSASTISQADFVTMLHSIRELGSAVERVEQRITAVSVSPCFSYLHEAVPGSLFKDKNPKLGPRLINSFSLFLLCHFACS